MKRTTCYIAVLVLSTLAFATPAQAGEGRKWKISYNSALSLHEAAMPARFKVGDKFKITYRQKSIIVTAIYGGCTCLDISDEAMNKLASTSKGIIKATVVPR